MEKLGNGERELVALGAALGSNCVPCAEHHIAEARRVGFSPRQLKEAVRLADHVRQAPARKVLAAALGVLAEPANSAAATPGGEARSVAEGELETAAAAGKPDDGPVAKGFDRRCCG